MVTVEIQMEENLLDEAEKVLGAIGMDIPMAVNIFLRRVVLEKGLPMTMTGSGESKKTFAKLPETPEEESEYEFIMTRTNKAITREMVEEVWRAFIKYSKGLGELSRLSDEVAEKSGMSRGSAFIYLNILANLVKGEPNTRTLKMKDLTFLMEKIRAELEDSLYQNAIKSLLRSIPYWQANLPGAFAEKVEAYCKNLQ